MVTFDIIKAFALLTFLISFLGFYLYQILMKRIEIKRAVREETGERHQAKSHIPDTAGIVMLVVYVIIFPIYIRFVDGFQSDASFRIALILYVAPLFFGYIGLLDDVAKNRSKSTRGLRALIRFPIQVIAAAGIVIAYMSLTGIMNVIAIVWLVIFIVATLNAANFTDGLDGLLTGCAIIAIIGFLLGDDITRNQLIGHLLLSPRSDQFIGVSPIAYSVLPLSIMAAFLFFNTYPAKMFMGDCGSMFIGSFLALLPVISLRSIQFTVIGFVIYIALISVVIQVVSYRLTRRRVFPITPLHHSFEKWGWNENHIVWFYYFLSIVFLIIGISFGSGIENYVGRIVPALEDTMDLWF